MSELIIKGKKSKEVSFILGNLSTGEKNKGLNKMADFLVNNKKEIINANKIDLQAAVEKLSLIHIYHSRKHTSNLFSSR